MYSLSGIPLSIIFWIILFLKLSSNALSLNINGTTSTAVYPGDLLIATAKEGKKEDADGKLAADDIAWVHVKAGYNEDLNDSLDVVAADNGVEVQLTSYPSPSAGDLGKFTIVTQSDNIAVNFDATNKVVGLSMVWDTF